MSWHFTQTENAETWLMCFNQVRDTPFAIVLDGKAGCIKAARARWPKIVIQRCQFHVIHYVNALLTKRPETKAARDFKRLVAGIIGVKTIDEWRAWVGDLKQWYILFGDIIKERTYHDSLTPTGRRKWSYTHARLHAAFFHVSHSFHCLFQYLKYPQIPNTSNRIEGSINASLQRFLDDHRGLNLAGQRQFISAFLRSK